MQYKIVFAIFILQSLLPVSISVNGTPASLSDKKTLKTNPKLAKVGQRTLTMQEKALEFNGNIKSVDSGWNMEITPNVNGVAITEKLVDNVFHLLIPHELRDRTSPLQTQPFTVTFSRDGIYGDIKFLIKKHKEPNWYTFNLDGSNLDGSTWVFENNRKAEPATDTEVTLLENTLRKDLLHVPDDEYKTVIAEFQSTKEAFKNDLLNKKAEINANNEKVFEGLGEIQKGQTTQYVQVGKSFGATNQLIEKVEGEVQSQGEMLMVKAEDIKTQANGFHADLKNDLKNQFSELKTLETKSDGISKEVKEVLVETKKHADELPKIFEAQSQLVKEVNAQKTELDAELKKQEAEIQKGNDLGKMINSEVVVVKNHVETELPKRLDQQNILLNTQKTELQNVDTKLSGFKTEFETTSAALNIEIQKTHEGIAGLKETQKASTEKLGSEIGKNTGGIQDNKALLEKQATELEKQNKVVHGIDNKATELITKSESIEKNVGIVQTKVEQTTTEVGVQKTHLHNELKIEIEKNRETLHGELKKDIGEKVDESAAKLHKDLDEDIGKRIAESAKKLHADLKEDIEKKIEDSEKKLHANLKTDIETKIDESAKQLHAQLKVEISNVQTSTVHEIAELNKETVKLQEEFIQEIGKAKTEIEAKINVANSGVLEQLKLMKTFIRQMKMQVIDEEKKR